DREALLALVRDAGDAGPGAGARESVRRRLLAVLEDGGLLRGRLRLFLARDARLGDVAARVDLGDEAGRAAARVVRGGLLVQLGDAARRGVRGDRAGDVPRRRRERLDVSPAVGLQPGRGRRLGRLLRDGRRAARRVVVVGREQARREDDGGDDEHDVERDERDPARAEPTALLRLGRRAVRGLRVDRLTVLVVALRRRVALRGVLAAGRRLGRVALLRRVPLGLGRLLRVGLRLRRVTLRVLLLCVVLLRHRRVGRV